MHSVEEVTIMTKNAERSIDPATRSMLLVAEKEGMETA